MARVLTCDSVDCMFGIWYLEAVFFSFLSSYILSAGGTRIISGIVIFQIFCIMILSRNFMHKALRLLHGWDSIYDLRVLLFVPCTPSLHNVTKYVPLEFLVILFCWIWALKPLIELQNLYKRHSLDNSPWCACTWLVGIYLLDIG